MISLRTITLATLAAAVAVAWPAATPRADSADDFYKGKAVNMYVGVAPGGIYSTFAQVLARHMEKHMPGKANVIVQHMEGAGGARSVDYIYNVAPKDGTYVITPNAGVAIRVLLKMSNTKYDPAKLRWLGGWGDAVNVLTLLEPAPVKTLAEAKQKEVILGAIGRNSNTFLIPTLINNTLGTKFKVITGYTGGAPIRLAIEKREIHGWTGQWEGWKMSKPEWIRDGKLLHLVQLGNERAQDLKNIPLLSEVAENDDQRAMFRIVQSGIADRAFVAPPGVPADRLAALERAYMRTLQDPAFVADAKRQQFDVEPVKGAAIQEFVEGMMTLPDSTVEKLRKLMGLGGQS